MESNRHFDAILDSMESGTLSSTADQTSKKKSWRKQLKEAFYPKTKTTLQKASLELLEKRKISRGRGSENV